MKDSFVVQQKKTALMYENIIGFSFPFITQNERMSKESRRQLSCTYRGWGKSLQWTPFFFLLLSGWNLHGYIKFQTPMKILMVTPLSACHLHIAHWQTSFEHATHTISCGYISSSLLLTQYMWSHILLACNFCCISAENTCILFILGTRCISCYVH